MVGSINEFVITAEGALEINTQFISDDRVKYVKDCILYLNSDKMPNGSGSPRVGADGKTWPEGSNIKWGQIKYVDN